MTRKVALKDQALFVLVARLSLPAGAFLLLISLGQISDRLLGEYALATTYYFILQTLPLMGLMPFYMREVARNPEKVSQYFFVLCVLTLLAALVLNLVLYLLLPLSHYPPNLQQAITLGGLATLPGILAFNAEITLTAQQKTKPIAVIASTENVLRLLASLAVLGLGYGVSALMLVLLFTRTYAVLCYTLFTKRHDTLNRPAFDGLFLQRSLKVLPVFLLNSLLCLLVSRLDFVMLSFFVTYEKIGYYAIGYRLFELFTIVINALLAAVFHIFARRYTSNWPLFRTTFRLFFPALLYALALTTLAAAFFAPLYVSVLFNNQWPRAVLITQCFTLLIFLHGMDYSLSQMLNAMDKQQRDTRALALSVPVYGLTLLVFVPAYGIIGAFFATAVTLLFQTTTRLHYLITLTAPAHRPLITAKESMALLALAGLTATTAHLGSHAALATQIKLFCLFALLAPLFLNCFDLCHPWRALSVLLAKSGSKAYTPTTVHGLISLLAFDHLKHASWWRKRTESGRIAGLGFVCIFILRLAQFAHTNYWHRTARALWQFNLVLTKADIRPDTRIGPGLILDNPVAIGISPGIGRCATLMAHAAIGRSGERNVGCGSGYPHVRDHVFLGVRASIFGGFDVQSGTRITAHQKVDTLAAIHRTQSGQ